MQAKELFTFDPACPFSVFFDPEAAPWAWLPEIGPALARVLPDLPRMEPGDRGGLRLAGEVFIDPTVVLPPFGSITGPAYIGPGCDLRPGVFIRGNVIATGGCVLGNSCEFKNSLLLDGVQAPHFNYVGDSVLGRRAHLGAGVILSNLRFDQAEIMTKAPGGPYRTGLRKLGGLLGDEAEVGCNSVLQPGTILGPRAVVAPGLAYGGYLAAARIAFPKTPVTILERERG